MATKVYRFSERARLPADKAQAVGLELERLADSAQGLTPAAVVARAQRKSSAMHDLFEWDDQRAAHSWRLEQASYLLRHVEVTVVVEGREVEARRAFANVHRADGDRVYEPMVRVMSDEDMRRQVLARALAELNAWRARHQHLTELAALFEAVDAETRALREREVVSV